MPRLCCSSMCCLSRKKRQSFPIHAKQQETEKNQVIVRPIGSIRITTVTKTIGESNRAIKVPKAVKNQPAEEGHVSPSRTPLVTSLDESKQLERPSSIKNDSESERNSPEARKSSPKSKMVLDNVRKMINDQNVKQKESV